MEHQAPDKQKSVFDWLTRTDEYVKMFSGAQTSLKIKEEKIN